jgi:hypothetical protein
MNPELFDNFCRVKIDQLEEVPDLKWNDSHVWGKLSFKLGKGYGGSTSAFAVVLLSIFLCFYIWKYANKENDQSSASKKVAPKINRQHDFLPNQRTESTSVNEAITVLKKNTSTPVNTTAISQSKKTLSLILPLERKLLSSSNIVQPSLGSQVSRPVKKIKESVLSPADSRNKIVFKKESEKEVYASMNSNGSSTGINYLRPVSRRFSLVYGLHLARTYNPYFDLETHNLSVDITSVQVPFQIRYYLLPKDNRLTAFVYTGLTGSFPVSRHISANNFILNAEAGAQAQYRLLSTKNGGAAFFFVRMPFYRQTIYNKYKP